MLAFIFITSSSTLFIAYNAREEHLIHLARAKGVGAGFVSYAQPIAPDLAKMLLKGYQADEWFCNPRNLKPLKQVGQLWYLDDLLVVPNVPELKRQILYEFHDVLSAGHVGTDKTIRAVLQHYWWPNITADVIKYVQTCPARQMDKPSNQLPAGLYQPLQLPRRPWSSA